MTPPAARRSARSSVLAKRSPELAQPLATKAGWTDLDVRAVDTVRLLAADAVQKVGNGHPGTAMSLAPVAYLLYQNLMVHDPADPAWLGRDRFVLSCGHSSLTQYIQLYLAGYGLELSDLKALRTWGSLTPGHPEVHHTKGVEITTGPLGSGLASAVGMAFAQRRQRYMLDADAKPGQSVFDHHIYALASDGDMMEGVTHEACSLAGHQELGNFTLIYDQNHISIEDDTNISFSEDVGMRYEAYGWDVRTVDWRKETADGKGGHHYVEDVDELLAAIEAGLKVTNKPSIVILRTIIGWPAPNKQDTGKAHGSALGVDEVKATHEILGFPDKPFPVEREVLAHARKVGARGKQAHKAWDKRFAAWRKGHPDGAALLERLVNGEVPDGLDKALATFPADLRQGAQRSRRGHAGALGRLGRPRRVQQHDHGGSGVLRPHRQADQGMAGRPRGPDPPLRHPRVRDGLHPQRHRPRGFDPPLRRHLPRLLRLHARSGTPGRTSGGAGHLRVDPRLDRAR